MKEPHRFRWIAEHATALVVATLAAILAAVIIALFSGGGDEPAAPLRVTIESPAAGRVAAPTLLPPGAEVKGTVRGEDDRGRHLWLVVRGARDRVVFVGDEIRQAGGLWKRPLPADLPVGTEFSVAIVALDDEAHERAGARAVAPTTAAPDTTVVVEVPGLAVEPERPKDPLYAVVPQAEASDGREFDFAGDGGRLTAAFDDDSACHRPERANGLRLAWDPGAKGSAGWGVQWSDSSGGRFDASAHGLIELSIKGDRGGETFQVGLKDVAGTERKVESDDLRFVPGRREWRTLTVPLGRFRGVDTAALENVNVGFNTSHGAGAMCVDALLFAGTPRERAKRQALSALRARRVRVEAERATPARNVNARSRASGGATLLLATGESATLGVRIRAAARYRVALRYSNDNAGPLERVAVTVDGRAAGSFDAQDTGGGGTGWNVFRTSGPIATRRLGRGGHRVRMSVSGGDGYGVELDRLTLSPVR